MKTFIVLGMHRSATSLIAKGLSQAGVRMGDHMIGAHKSNPWGHWEDIEFVHLNDMILNAAGGAWNKPPEECQIVEAGKSYEAIIKDLIHRKSRWREIWGWKDPRTVLTVKCFLPFIENPHFVCCFRAVDDVAKSLETRGDMSVAEAEDLAKIYNDRLLGFISGWYSGEGGADGVDCDTGCAA